MSTQPGTPGGNAGMDLEGVLAKALPGLTVLDRRLELDGPLDADLVAIDAAGRLVLVLTPGPSEASSTCDSSAPSIPAASVSTSTEIPSRTSRARAYTPAGSLVLASQWARPPAKALQPSHPCHAAAQLPSPPGSATTRPVPAACAAKRGSPLSDSRRTRASGRARDTM